MATKFQYNEEAYNSNWALYTPGNVWGAQTFSHSADYEITYVELFMHKSGAGGNVTVSIKAVDGSNHPTGADLAVSNPVDCTGIIGFEWVTFTFISPYTLSSGVTYAIVARNDSTLANAVRWEVDTSSPSYANGNFVTSSDSGSSWTTRTWDSIFRAWGNPAVTYYDLTVTMGAISSMSGLLTIANIVDITGTIDVVTTLIGLLSISKYIAWLKDRPDSYDADLYWDEETETWSSTRVSIPGAFAEYLVAIGEEGAVYFRSV